MRNCSFQGSGKGVTLVETFDTAVESTKSAQKPNPLYNGCLVSSRRLKRAAAA